MLAGKVKKVTYGATNELVIEMEGNAEEFCSQPRVIVAIIPDDTELKRAYERGRYDAKMDEHWAIREFLDERD